MADVPTTRLPKPQLRGMLARHMKIHLSIAMGLSVALAYAHKVFVADARKQRYADFYKTYDAEADFQRMKKLGVL